MRMYLRGICHKQLARAERLINAWPDPFNASLYVYTGERNSLGVPITTMLNQGNEYTPSVRSQLKSFIRRVVLKEEQKLTFSMKVKPEEYQHIEYGYPSSSWHGPRHN